MKSHAPAAAIPSSSGPAINPRRGKAVKPKKGKPAVFISKSAAPATSTMKPPKGTDRIASTETTTDGHSDIPPRFDPAPILEEIGMYWLVGSQSYFLRREEGTRVRFVDMGGQEIRRKLRVRGFRNRPNSESGEAVSQIDRILDAATEKHAVDLCIRLAGWKAGVYDMEGGRVLVLDSPVLIEPRQGNSSTIEAFLSALLGTKQSEYLCAWLKVAYEALRAGRRTPGQCLIIAGPPGCGKTLLQSLIITPILGGRSADPKAFFFGRTDFNVELIAAEHLLIGEVPSSSRYDDRLFFGERIKEVVANNTQRLHKKNRDAVTVSPFNRPTVTLNDEPEKLGCLPPLTGDFREKVMLFKAGSAVEFWKTFDDVEDLREAVRAAFERELPAFLDYLLRWEIPAEMRDRRYGVKSYYDQELFETVNEADHAEILLGLMDVQIWKDGEALQPWKGKAVELQKLLTSEESEVRFQAKQILTVSASRCGQILRALAKRYPARVQEKRQADGRIWIIQPPAR